MCQSFWDVQYSKLEFGKGYHRKLKCLVWRSHVAARLRDSNMVAGNQWKHLEFTLADSKRLSSVKTFKHRHFSQRIGYFSQHMGYSELENIKRIDIFVHVTCYPETMPMSCIYEKSVLFSKQSGLPS